MANNPLVPSPQVAPPSLPAGGPDPMFQGRGDDGFGEDSGGMGYGLIHFKGKEFYVRYGGQKKTIAKKGADGYLHKVSYIDVIVLKRAPRKSRTYYEGTYNPNSVEGPTCLSTDGIAPDDASKTKQSARCDICPKAIRNPRPDGKKTSECRENLRLAVFPLSPEITETLGVAVTEPVLMRVTASSLRAFDRLCEAVRQEGGKNAPLYSFITRISFKDGVDWPEYEYRVPGWLKGDAAKFALEMSEHPLVHRIMGVTPEGRSLVRREEGQLSAMPVQQIATPDPVAERLAAEREARIAAARQQQPPPTTIDVVAEEVRASENVVPMKKPLPVEDAPPSIDALVAAMRPRPPGT